MALVEQLACRLVHFGRSQRRLGLRCPPSWLSGRGFASRHGDDYGQPATDDPTYGAAASQPGDADVGRGRKNAKSGAGSNLGGRDREQNVAEQVEKHFLEMQKNSGSARIDPDWRKAKGNAVPARFRLQEPKRRTKDEGENREKSKPEDQALPYTDYAGLRFPTLESAENFDYHKDRGLDRVTERSYPIRVPKHRKIDPYLREYIYFLHDLDPVRFTVTRIAQRYRMREKTVAKVVQEWGVNRYLTRTGLTRLRDKQTTREAVVLAKKEAEYAKWVGWDQLGDEDEPESDDEALGEFKGWRSTNDWVRRQNVEVEMMSAFPMMEKRDPMPKRVDVDMVVDSKQHHKVINWIDPMDKVVF